MNHPSPLHHDTDAKLPAAAYLRYESRADGWSAGRQAAFLSHLADNGLVEDAARSVGMSVGGGYSLRRTSRGYAFNLGWEAALIIARRVISDRLMTAAIKGEEARWVREDNVTTYTRQNTKLSLALLDRINPATTLSEVMAVATRFDWFLQLIDEGASAEELWDLFFDDALPTSDIEARARVRASLLLCEESAGFDDEPPIEYKSMDGPVLEEPERGTPIIDFDSIARPELLWRLRRPATLHPSAKCPHFANPGHDHFVSGFLQDRDDHRLPKHNGKSGWSNRVAMGRDGKLGRFFVQYPPLHHQRLLT
jgi:hypothetical protein